MGNKKDNQEHTQRFLDVLYRSDMMLSEENTKKQHETTGEESKNYRHRSQQYLAILHRMNNLTQNLECNGDLPRGELNALMTIGGFDHRSAGVSSTEISQNLRVSTAATSKMLKILEDKGLIYRHSDAKDRRKVYITLTVEGYRIYEETSMARADYMDRVFSKMGQEDTDAYLTLWEKFNKIMEDENRVSTDIVRIKRDALKTVFIDESSFSFTEGDVLERMGMPRNHSFGAKIKELMAVAAPLAAPKAFYMEVSIEKRTEKTVTLAGETFTSLALAKNFEQVDVVYPYLCTCGHELAEYAKTIKGLMEQYAFDAIMEFYRKRMLIALTETLANALEDGGQTSSVSPGSLVDWSIYEQRKLFRVFGDNAEKIGVELSENSLMYPIKTVSGIRYATDKDFHNCLLCQKEKCPHREAPFNLDLYLKTFQD